MNFKDNILTKIIVGMFSGIGNGLASIDGPPVVAYLTTIKVDQKTFKNVLAGHFLLMGILAAVVHYFNGAYKIDTILNTLYLSIGAIMGINIGIKIARYINQELFDKIVLVLLLILSITMII